MNEDNEKQRFVNILDAHICAQEGGWPRDKPLAVTSEDGRNAMLVLNLKDPEQRELYQGVVNFIESRGYS